MDNRAQMYFEYQNSLNQQVVIHVVANAQTMYKTFWWGAYTGNDPATSFELQVGTPYILTSGTTYTILPWFQGLAMLDFSSASEHHDYFDIDYVKNGSPYVKLQQASFQNTTFEGATCKVCDDGKIQIYFDDSDPVNTYKVVGYITPVAKAGYKLSN